MYTIDVLHSRTQFLVLVQIGINGLKLRGLIPSSIGKLTNLGMKTQCERVVAN
jgi:hypothetical protein